MSTTLFQKLFQRFGFSRFSGNARTHRAAITPLAQGNGRTPQTALSSELEAEADLADDVSADDALIDNVLADIRATRKFSLADAIGKEAGSFLKSNAAIPRPIRAANILNHFIHTHTSESTGALSTTLQLWSRQDIRVSRQLDTPLNALDEIISSLLCEPTTFYEFARQVAIAHSQITGERPYFQSPNQPPNPKADYTYETIRTELKHLQKQLHYALSSESSPNQPSSSAL